MTANPPTRPKAILCDCLHARIDPVQPWESAYRCAGCGQRWTAGEFVAWMLAVRGSLDAERAARAEAEAKADELRTELENALSRLAADDHIRREQQAEMLRLEAGKQASERVVECARRVDAAIAWHATHTDHGAECDCPEHELHRAIAALSPPEDKP